MCRRYLGITLVKKKKKEEKCRKTLEFVALNANKKIEYILA